MRKFSKLKSVDVELFVQSNISDLLSFSGSIYTLS